MRSANKPFTGLIRSLIYCVLLAPIHASAVQATNLAPTLTYERATDALIVAAAAPPTGEMPDQLVEQLDTILDQKIDDKLDQRAAESSAEEEKALEVCDIDFIIEAFKKYKPEKSEEQVKNIQILLNVFGYDPVEIDGKLGVETDGALASLCLDYKVKEYLADSERLKGDPSKHLVEHLTRLLEEPDLLRQSKKRCGCSRDFSAQVYGFYPYLLARSAEQDVDFSLFDRIGFHMQVLNKVGNIPAGLRWRDNNDSGRSIAQFISRAHKHRVKVDATFYAYEWQDWKDKDNAISNAVANIVATASQEFHESDAKLWRNLFPQRFDGVNLYFDNYTDDASSSVLVEIVQSLGRELKNAEPAIELNIILGVAQSDIQKVELAKLKEIVVGEKGVVDKVLVRLPRNTVESAESRKKTSKAKKALRQNVENAFSGNNRTKVLRKIIPIFTPAEFDFKPLPNNDAGDSQFDDDLIYSKDNFAGVGLWPLLPKSKKVAEEIEKALTDHYQAKDDLNDLGEILNDYVPWVCKIVCPHRVWFYLALGLLVGILVIYALLAVSNCRLREIYRRHLLYFILLFIMMTLVLVVSLVCDPSWEKWVNSVVIGILLLVIVGIGWRSMRKAVQPPFP